MKKILLLVLVALVLVALVACGGETTTTPTTTTTPGTSGQNPGGDPGNDPGNDPGEITPPDEEKLYDEGVDIMTGEPDDISIEAFKMNERAVAFENWHEILDFHWATVIAMCDSENKILDKILDRTDESGNITVRPEYKWVLVINGDEVVVQNFDTELKVDTKQGTEWIYVRMDLGKDWTFEQGSKEYDISLKICDFFSDKIEYWAYLTDPALSSAYSFAPPKEIEMIPDPDSQPGEDEYRLLPDMILPLQGPGQTANGEFYAAIFDGNAGTKLCTRDMSKDVIFAISDSVYSANFKLTSISIVGANDDENRPNRAITKFVLYGADSGDAEDDEWEAVLTVDNRDSFIAKNYGERHYKLDEPVSYQYYKLVVVDPQLDEGREHKGPIFQLSELLVFADASGIVG